MHTNLRNLKQEEIDSSVMDLSPLAWVFDELQKSLESALKGVKRFVRHATADEPNSSEELDSKHLHLAAQHLHQVAGVLNVVGYKPCAVLVGAMEALVKKCIQDPAQCDREAVSAFDRAAFALIEYLEAVLANKRVYSLSLFPQYRNLQQRVQASRIHPADLWSFAWSWKKINLDSAASPRSYDASSSASFEQLVLQVMKDGSVAAAQQLHNLCLEFAAAQTVLSIQTFWSLLAAYFEAIEHQLLPSDVYVKRTTSKAMVYSLSLFRGDAQSSDRLVQDLLFFCAQASVPDALRSSTLARVRHAYGLDDFQPIDYELVQFSRFDPILLIKARKRIASAKQTWEALSTGDAIKFQFLAEQFRLVCDSLFRLYAPTKPLAQALVSVAESIIAAKRVPAIGLVMEVATSLLYLEAVFRDQEVDNEKLLHRIAYLTERLERVETGADSLPLESWVEDLYRRVSDKQTMGSLVGELRINLAEVEKILDAFSRDPKDRTITQDVSRLLAQMRGAFSVLGLDQAVHAALQMQRSIEQMLSHDAAENMSLPNALLDALGNNLSTLSFLIDMLGYQPILAKKIFIFDEQKGQLRSLMGSPDKVLFSSPEIKEKPPSDLPPPVLEKPKTDDPATPLAWTPQPALESTQITEFIKLEGTADFPVLNASLATLKNALNTVAQDTPSDAAPSNFPAQRNTAAPDVLEDQSNEDDLQAIFLSEARDLVATALELVEKLRLSAQDTERLISLRRAFHTLKGSSRMVGLHEFGEAAWAFEQLLNAWLAKQKVVTDDFLNLIFQAVQGISAWLNDISLNQGALWLSEAFRKSADLMLTRGQFVPLDWSVHGNYKEHTPNHAFELNTSVASVQNIGVSQKQANVPFNDFDTLDFAATTIQDAPSDWAVLEPSPTLQQLEKQAGDLNTFSVLPGAGSSQDVAVEFLTENLSQSSDDSIFTQAAPADSAAESLPHDLTVLSTLDDPMKSDQASAGLFDISADQDTCDKADEQFKTIGHLRISPSLYNVYLTEADEWSRRLLNELTAWSLDPQAFLTESVVVCAHSLVGSSAAVGFTALSELARALEYALQQLQAAPEVRSAGLTNLLVNAAEEVCQLLHQFAAGFLKTPHAAVMEQLLAIKLEVVTDIDDERVFTEDAFNKEPKESELEPLPLASVPEQMSAASEEIHLKHEIQGSQLDEEIDLIDVVDTDLLSIFEEEATELMPKIGNHLRLWSSDPENKNAREEVLRILHTLKGGARLTGALRLGEMAHRMESEIVSTPLRSVNHQWFDDLLRHLDAMVLNFQGLLDTAQDTLPLEVSISLPALQQDTPSHLSEAPVFNESSVVVPTSHNLVPEPIRSVQPILKKVTTGSVRVRSQLLERMVNQAGEVMMTRSRLEAELSQLRISLKDMSENLNRLREHLRDIEAQTEGQMQSRLAQSKEVQQGFDPLELDRFTRVQELTRMMAESINDVATVHNTLQRIASSTEDDLVAQARQTRELQRDLLRTRLVEFESISERLYRVVRLASKETGKQVRLDLIGTSLEMDRGMLDRMTPTFEHILRNCVAHGIEAASIRTAAGKDAVGLITLTLHQEGNDVSVDFRDDGAGLDLKGIRQKALSLGLFQVDQDMTEQDAIDCIFRPGFSTVEQVNELAGRGIGMDVVRSEVKAVGGRIETSTIAGQGISFKLVLPLTTAVNQVVMLRFHQSSMGIPTNLVETVQRATVKDLQQSYNTGFFEFAQESIPFFWAGALLQHSAQSQEDQVKTMPVVICRSAAQRIALHVDEVLGTQELVVKNLGPQLSRLPGLAGMSVLASGAVILIYNPVALASVYGAQARLLSSDRAEPKALERLGQSDPDGLQPTVRSATPLVLVVDDSITVRRVTQRLLQREGYRVALAADGFQALERLQEERPAVILSDIEMPRMDGFTLVREIKANPKLRDLPVIMITSRLAEKHRSLAKQLGVEHYLGKPYSEEELLSLIRHFSSVIESTTA